MKITAGVYVHPYPARSVKLDMLYNIKKRIRVEGSGLAWRRVARFRWGVGCKANRRNPKKTLNPERHTLNPKP